MDDEKATHIDPLGDFEPTFTGTRQERRFVRESLHDFIEDHWFTDILYRVKGGKEATVYCCRAHPSTGLDLIAAKVFRPRIFRAMKNDALYKEGRGVRNWEGKYLRERRGHRAFKRGSSYGQRLDTFSWVRHEYGALVDLHRAGAEVPRPLARTDNAILMEFIGDDVMGAPVLSTLTLEPNEARVAFDRLLRNVEVLLRLRRVHADLSAYNVLVWDGEVYLIDFPQCVDALNHPTAFELFARDIDRLGRYFERQGVEVDATGIAVEMWRNWIG